MDVENGDWAILGARMSTSNQRRKKRSTLIADYDYKNLYKKCYGISRRSKDKKHTRAW